MAPCWGVPTILVLSDDQLFAVTAGEFLLGSHVTSSCLAGSLVGQNLAISLLSRGFSYSSDGIVASQPSCFSTSRVYTTCSVLLEINQETGPKHLLFE